MQNKKRFMTAIQRTYKARNQNTKSKKHYFFLATSKIEKNNSWHSQIMIDPKQANRKHTF
jgi:hypothetical protein